MKFTSLYSLYFHVKKFSFALLILVLPFYLFGKEPVPAIKPASSSLVFIENGGQITDQYYNPRNDIDFKLNAPGMDAFIGEGQIHYQFTRQLADKQVSPVHDATGLFGNVPLVMNKLTKEEIKTETYRLDVVLLGANKKAKIITGDAQEYYENYYLPSCANGAKAHSFKRVIYKDIYPNIDWVVYLASPSGYGRGSLKYDFVVHPGGDVEDIRIQYNGATSLSLQNRALTAFTPFGSLTENAPYSYYLTGMTQQLNSDDNKKQVESKYILRDNIISFDIAPYEGTLVIDPQLEWATYYGGSGKEELAPSAIWVLGTDMGMYGTGNIETDHLNNIYLPGRTYSVGNIATSGAFLTSLAGRTDLFIVKFNAVGQRLWATYYGGKKHENEGYCKTDKDGNVYLAGNTGSDSGIATPGTHQPQMANNDDGFLVKFDKDGSRLWATYYGGESNDDFNDITTDTSGNIYLCGETSSKTGISSPGAFLDSQVLNGCLFVVKFSPGGIKEWGTYYPAGNTLVSTWKIVPDLTGNIYVAGICIQYYPSAATTQAHQASHGGAEDGILIKFNAAGKRLWASFYGGEKSDGIFALTCDKKNNVYIAGATGSKDSIATQGAFQDTISRYHINGSGSLLDAFIAKFDSAGIRQWGSYYGGSVLDDFTGMAIDNNGDIALVGLTYSDGLATAGSWQSKCSFFGDAMFVKFTPDGQLLWSTYYGGEEADLSAEITISPAGDYIFNGQTRSTTGIATAGSHQESFCGHTDLFVVKALPDSLIYIVCDSVYCFAAGSDSIMIRFATTRSFYPGNVYTVQLSDSNGSFATPLMIGQFTSTASGSIKCTIPGSIRGDGYRIRLLASMPAFTSFDNGFNISFGDSPGEPVITGDHMLCTGESLELVAGSGIPNVNYSWLKPDRSKDTGATLIKRDISLQDSGYYTVTARLGKCTNDQGLFVSVYKMPALEAWNNSPVMEGAPIRLFANEDSAYAYLWTGPANYGSAIQNPVIPIATLNLDSTTYMVTATNAYCIDTAYTTVFVEEPGDDILVLFPNPNDGKFTIKGSLRFGHQLQIGITNIGGQKIYTDKATTNRRRLDHNVILPAVANGVYILHIRFNGSHKSIPFIVNR